MNRVRAKTRRPIQPVPRRRGDEPSCFAFLALCFTRWGPSSNGTKTLCFCVVSGGQLDLLNCISRVSEGSELTALHRLGQAEVIAPVQVDVLVHQWGKTLDVLGVGSLAKRP